MEIVDAGNRMLVKANNDIPFTQSSISCRAVGLERYNQDSALNRKVIVPHDSAWQRNVLSGQTDITATYFAVANQATGYELGSVNGSSKRDSLGRQNHRRVYADHFSARVNQRPTRITGIERGVSLNH